MTPGDMAMLARALDSAGMTVAVIAAVTDRVADADGDRTLAPVPGPYVLGPPAVSAHPWQAKINDAARAMTLTRIPGSVQVTVLTRAFGAGIGGGGGAGGGGPQPRPCPWCQGTGSHGGLCPGPWLLREQGVLDALTDARGDSGRDRPRDPLGTQHPGPSGGDGRLPYGR